jgi:hypothetical protein
MIVQRTDLAVLKPFRVREAEPWREILTVADEKAVHRPRLLHVERNLRVVAGAAGGHRGDRLRWRERAARFVECTIPPR